MFIVYLISKKLTTPLDHKLSIFTGCNSSFRIYKQGATQRYTYRVLQTIQIELILLCVWAEPAVLGSAKTALKFKYEI